MPNSRSAAKRVRQNATHYARNRRRMKEVRTAIRDFGITIQAGDVAKATTQLSSLFKLLDQVSSTSTMHKKTADRYKSRLSIRLNAIKAGKPKAA